ncbi:MAG: hypothetical protein ACTSUK_11845 [Promethearchaeota archaeon]
MSLREDFKDLSYEIVRIAEKERNIIRKKAEQQIKEIEEEFQQKINQDTLKLELESITKKEFELNKVESDKITVINQAIAEKKTKCIKDFLKLIQLEIRKRILDRQDLYMYFLIERMQSIAPLINEPVIIQFNKEDLEYAQKFDFLEKLMEKKEFFEISKEPIDTGIGFKIVSKSGRFVIDYTFNALVEKYYQKIEIRFMKIFPIFEVNVRNAMEIDKEKHGKAKRYEL